MRSRTPISLFPFLSVLLSTMGVLAFLAVTFLLFTSATPLPQAEPQEVDVSWVGAPGHVRPLLVECRGNGVVYHHRAGGGTVHFSVAALEREVEVVRELVDSGQQALGPVPDRTQLWLFLKSAIDNEPRLDGSFTALIHAVEMDNLGGRAQAQQVERYPILLVYPDGIETYELASYLVETTTRLALGLEPMLKGWELPYREVGS